MSLSFIVRRSISITQQNKDTFWTFNVSLLTRVLFELFLSAWPGKGSLVSHRDNNFFAALHSSIHIYRFLFLGCLLFFWLYLVVGVNVHLESEEFVLIYFVFEDRCTIKNFLIFIYTQIENWLKKGKDTDVISDASYFLRLHIYHRCLNITYIYLRLSL